MANFNSTYFVIECASGEEFESGSNSKTNGLYSSKGKALQHIREMIRCYERHLSRSHISSEAKEVCLKQIERYNSMKVTEVKVVRIE